MGRIGRFGLGLLLLLACAGCEQARVISTVNRTDLLPPVLEDRTVYVQPSQEQETSAEFIRYAEMLYRELAGSGLRRAPNFEAADYLAFMSYGVSGSRTETGSIPIYGQTGGGTAYQSGTINTFRPGGLGTSTYSGTSYTPPTTGVVGSVPYSTTLHNRFLGLRIVDRSASRDRPPPVYEGQVTSTGSNELFAQVSACMFTALFKNFRKSGSEKVEVPSEICLGK